jgi:hypothetical protein
MDDEALETLPLRTAKEIAKNLLLKKYSNDE